LLTFFDPKALIAFALNLEEEVNKLEDSGKGIFVTHFLIINR